MYAQGKTCFVCDYDNFIFFFTVRSVRREVKSDFVGSVTREHLPSSERSRIYSPYVADELCQTFKAKYQ